jgi:hypothetical protein
MGQHLMETSSILTGALSSVVDASSHSTPLLLLTDPAADNPAI